MTVEEQLIHTIRTSKGVGVQQAMDLLRCTRKAGCEALGDLYLARVLVGLVKTKDLKTVKELAQYVDENPTCLVKRA